MRIVRPQFLSVLHGVEAAHADRLHQLLGGIAHHGVDRPGDARQRAVAQRRQDRRRGGVEGHHGVVAGAFLDDAEVEPPGMAGALGRFGRVEGLQPHIEHRRQLGQRLQHLFRRRRVGVVDVQHGDVRDVEAQGFVDQAGVQQLFTQQPADGDGEEIVHFLRQGVDQPEGPFVLAKGRRAQHTVVDGALGEGGPALQQGQSGDGKDRRAAKQLEPHDVSPECRSPAHAKCTGDETPLECRGDPVRQRGAGEAGKEGG